MSARAALACSCLLVALGVLAGGATACTDDTRVNSAFPAGDDAGAAGAEGGPGAGVDASSLPPVEIDDVIEPLRAGSGVPGIAALVLRDGAVVAEGVAGVRKLGDPTPLTTSDTWYLGTTAVIALVALLWPLPRGAEELAAERRGATRHRHRDDEPAEPATPTPDVEP